MLKKILTRVIVLLLVFAAGVVVFSHIRNQEDAVEAVEMEAAVLPVLYMQEGDILINPMFGNKTQMDGTTVRDHLTLLPTDRNLKVAVDTKGQEISSVIYTVKNTDGTEIVENSAIRNFSEDNGYQKADVHLDTPILLNQEYILEFQIELESGESAYYYTRLVQRSGVTMTDYLEFANMFYQTCLDKSAAESLSDYMESNSSNANDSFQNVDIHSSVDQISWGNLAPQLVKTGVPRVNEINETTASISVDYMISSTDDDGNVEYYTVTDFYRMRRASDRVALLDFERSATQVFDADLPVLTSKGINLGVVPQDTQYVASTAGDIVAFVVNGDLWSYNRSANKCTRVFSFREDGESGLDERYQNDAHDIRIVRVSESGDLTFVVYGYMNRGKHEDVEELWAEKNYEKHLVNMDSERQELYETCQRLGVGITVMKAFGGGDLLDAKLSPAGRALTVNQCIHYALTRPAVATVLSGAHSVEQLRESTAYEDASEAERDYAAAFASFPNISWEGHCMYCSHCAPCPKKIDVASVTKFLNLAKAQGTVPETVREHYEVLAHHAGECIRCGACETRCPFGVPIMENMAQAKEIFGK